MVQGNRWSHWLYKFHAGVVKILIGPVRKKGVTRVTDISNYFAFVEDHISHIQTERRRNECKHDRKHSS